MGRRIYCRLSVCDWLADHSDRRVWETAELDSKLPDASIKLFRHDGVVLHYQSYRWASAAEVAPLLIDTYYGDNTIKLDTLADFAEWLEDEHGLDEDSRATSSIVAALLRHVADQLTN